ncbi:MAG: pyridoxal phosphate-dependent aminotransferase [Candidatus Hydrothermales bacterium]
MRISKRVRLAQYSPIRKFYPYAIEAKKRGIEVFHLNIGEPDIKAPETFFKAIREFDKEIIGYGPSDGIPELKEAWYNYYKRKGYNISPDDVMITTAGSEALIFSFFSVADEGKEIIVFEPFYTNYNTFARIAGVKLVPVPTFIKDNFRLPSEKEIKKYINSRTRAIVYANPNNPTGKVYSREEIEMLIRLAKKHKLFIIADEVYREFVYRGHKHYSILEFEEASDFGIVADSVSKRYSLCGARIGCIVTRNKTLRENILKLLQARLSAPIIEQYACAEVINKEDRFIEEAKEEYERRIEKSMKILLNSDLIFTFEPQGAFYTMVDLKSINSDQFTCFLLSEFEINKKTTMVAPGNGFYVTKGKGETEVRIAFVLNSSKLELALNIFLEGIKKFREVKYEKT